MQLSQYHTHTTDMVLVMVQYLEVRKKQMFNMDYSMYTARGAANLSNLLTIGQVCKLKAKAILNASQNPGARSLA